jgi:serine/threonine protein kinase
MIACKHLLEIFTEWQKADFHRELEVMMSCDHPCVVNLHGFAFARLMNGVGEEVIAPSIFMEYYSGGSLSDRPNDGIGRRRRHPLPGWTSTAKSNIFFGVACGMAHVHRRHVIHRDLKPANVLLNASFEPSVGDFGISRIIDSPNITGGRRTPLFMAPEVVSSRSKGITQKCDVYSFAILVYQIFCRDERLEDMTPPTDPGREQKVAGGMRFRRPRAIPDSLWELVVECWRQDPASRPGFDDVVSRLSAAHDWCFPNTDVDELMLYESRCLSPAPRDVDVSRNSLISRFPISLADWVEVRLIGCGSFSKVILARHTLTGELLAQKPVCLSGGPWDLLNMYWELEL